MPLWVFARRQLVNRKLSSKDTAILIEGSWPDDTQSLARSSLDDSIDGGFEWIDRQAAEFSDLLGAGGISPAYLNALALRYYLVKLLRVVAFFTEIRPLQPNECVELTAEEHDEDYADVLSRLCLAAGATLRVRWVDDRSGGRGGFPPNAPWRRWAGRLTNLLAPPPDRGGTPRVVLCGNPRLLDPLCRELLARGCNLWWLYDRFAFRSWARWQSTGVRQLVCDSNLGRENRLSVEVPRRLHCRGVNLAAPVERWLCQRTQTHGRRQTRLIEQMDEHFRRVKPDALVLDEDATPMARAAVAVGRRHAIGSLVVQHGVPCCRFGFAPPAADRVLAWGRSSREQLIRWGVPPEQIRITGPTCSYARQSVVLEGNRPRILMLTSVPPRDGRPDAVALQMTGRSYAEMLRTAFSTVAGIAGAELIVKLHPRCPDDPVVRELRADFPRLNVQVVKNQPFQKWLGMVACVLSCGSSAGVEAAAAGVPVIQLLPSGSNDLLPHDEWGMLATARTEAELQPLLARVLVEGWRPPAGPDPNVFARFDVSSIVRIADEVLDVASARHQLQPGRPSNAARVKVKS